ncbi:hypothetical protein MYX82_14690, partial [Acidobacteria bacterium AH-259-D05]|nr:hypothetical protein [Acidobacteria bacterium AH-259-D05]
MPEDDNQAVFSVWINPLAFLQVDEPWANLSSEQFEPTLSAEVILEYLCRPESADTESAIDRYKQISQEPKRLFAAPEEQHILEKLVWPLKNAKACYAVGNYLGTIALCGMVAEMVAILFFEISNFVVNQQPMKDNIQERVFGSTFERLGQERRVNVLYAYGVIDSTLKSQFGIIKQIRKQYLHLYSHDHAEVAMDAVKAFNATVSL